MGSISTKKAKWALIIINIFATLLGIAVVTVGGVTESHVDLNPGINAAAIIFIISGIIMLIVSIIGIIATIRESSTLLLVYIVLSVPILAAVFGVSVAAFVNYSYADVTAEYFWLQAPWHSRETFEIYFECCGWMNVSESTGCPVAAPKGGCETPMINQIQRLDVGIGITGTIVVALQFVAVSFAALVRHRKLSHPDKIRFVS